MKMLDAGNVTSSHPTVIEGYVKDAKHTYQRVTQSKKGDLT